MLMATCLDNDQVLVAVASDAEQEDAPVYETVSSDGKSLVMTEEEFVEVIERLRKLSSEEIEGKN